MRIPSGTAMAEAMAKPIRMRLRLAQVWPQSDLPAMVSVIRRQIAITTFSGGAMPLPRTRV